MSPTPTLNAPTFDGVTIHPPGPPGALNILRYGAVDARGGQVNLGPLLISSRAFRIFPRRVTPASLGARQGPHIWAGTFYTHFGHFITETLPRLLSLRPLLDASATTRLLAFAPPEDVAASPLPVPPDFPAHVHWFATRLGLDLSRVDIIRAPTTVARLTVPVPPFTGRFAYTPALRGIIAASGLPAPKPSGAHIFLSRGQLGAKRARVVNIDAIEQVYAKAGFTILHPETLSLEDQLHHLTAAHTLAGENGSALHWSLYSPHVKVVQSLGWDLALQRGICALWGQDYTALRAPWTGRFQGRSQTVPLSVVTQHLPQQPGGAAPEPGDRAEVTDP